MGTRSLSAYRLSSKWDHPHAYGDKITLISADADIVGSSPRVWGQAYGYVSDAEYTGIIPTRMGTRRTQPN